jgi:hypothetical protein
LSEEALKVSKQSLHSAIRSQCNSETSGATTIRKQLAAEARRTCVYEEFEVDVVDDEDEVVHEPYRKARTYVSHNVFVHLNKFIRDRGKLRQHAKDLLNMRPLIRLIIVLAVALLRETLFTQKKWERAVDMHHALNLGWHRSN